MEPTIIGLIGQDYITVVAMAVTDIMDAVTEGADIGVDLALGVEEVAVASVVVAVVFVEEVAEEWEVAVVAEEWEEEDVVEVEVVVVAVEVEEDTAVVKRF